jgi:predicted nuclease of predicted toxin-antitoxin system
MKLLFDDNLSLRLALLLSDLYPNSQYVFPLQIDRDDDGLLLDYAIQNDYVTVTRNSDYNDSLGCYTNTVRIQIFNIVQCLNLKRFRELQEK